MLMFALWLQVASARSITVETRVRETGREYVASSECAYYPVIGKNYYNFSYATMVSERVTHESYLVEVTSDGWFGDRSERLLPGGERTSSAIEVTKQEFWGVRSKEACETYRASFPPKP